MSSFSLKKFLDIFKKYCLLELEPETPFSFWSRSWTRNKVAPHPWLERLKVHYELKFTYLVDYFWKLFHYDWKRQTMLSKLVSNKKEAKNVQIQKYSIIYPIIMIILWTNSKRVIKHKTFNFFIKINAGPECLKIALFWSTKFK